MTLWAAAYRTLSPMSSAFFVLSRPGLEGLAHYLRGHYGPAARAYRAAQRGWSPREYADDTAGAEALYGGDLALAERRAHTTLALVPTSVEPLVTLGEVALERGDDVAALGHLRQALARRPEHIDALLLAAVAWGRAGDSGAAIDAMNRALRHGSAGDRPTLLVRVLEVAGDLAARPAGRRPLSLLAHYHRYLRIFDEAQTEVAMAWARQAVAARDHPADAWFALGIMHDKRGEHAAALEAFERAIALERRHAEAYRWAAVEAGILRDPVRQYRMMRAALEAAPGDPFYLAAAERIVLARLGDARTMAALAERAAAADPASPLPWETLARAAAARGEAAQATTYFQRAADLREERRAR
jgi:tetratricopeptide (TPR) repeat protein